MRARGTLVVSWRTPTRRSAAAVSPTGASARGKVGCVRGERPANAGRRGDRSTAARDCASRKYVTGRGARGARIEMLTTPIGWDGPHPTAHVRRHERRTRRDLAIG